MKYNFRTKIVTLAVAVILVLSLCLPAFAADAEEKFDERKGSISVTLTERGEEDKAVAGAELTLHKVGDLQVKGLNLAYTLTSKFRGSLLDLGDISADGLADKLVKYARENEIKGTDKRTGAEGRVVFEDLDLGLYLVMQKTPMDGYYPIASFLVSVPMTSQDGTEWVYDIDASPKVEPVPVKPTPSSPPGSPGPSTPPGPPEPPPMIQTGQLNWPVPVLAVAGIILFTLGWSLTYLKSKKENEG